mmetsp:Transcript_30840/g.86059  ORF Transcript_30840/g.86059 Transcript_30840/m.86059 type:complete len:201 (+) Transcript_30840:297-899(+)
MAFVSRTSRMWNPASLRTMYSMSSCRRCSVPAPKESEFTSAGTRAHLSEIPAATKKTRTRSTVTRQIGTTQGTTSTRAPSDKKSTINNGTVKEIAMSMAMKLISMLTDAFSSTAWSTFHSCIASRMSGKSVIPQQKRSTIADKARHMYREHWVHAATRLPMVTKPIICMMSSWSGMEKLYFNNKLMHDTAMVNNQTASVR